MQKIVFDKLAISENVFICITAKHNKVKVPVVEQCPVVEQLK